MPNYSPRLEIETIEKLQSCLSENRDLSRAVFQSVDLVAVTDLLVDATLKDNVLLGCTTNEAVLALFDNPIVFPILPGLPFNPFRSQLYDPDELLGAYKIGDHATYQQTVDGKCYAHYLTRDGAESMDVYVTLARRLHDHAMTDALQEYIEGKRVVAIMGGHSLLRDDPNYIEVARLAKDLIQEGFLPTSGGGPGAMEATHLGAWFAERPDKELIAAVEILSEAPLYDPIGPWLDTAFRVAEEFPLSNPEKCQSLGIPTWLYGHEPPTRFATHIAKYFANSVREEGLLAIAKHGVVFAPGSAGTIQEVFQDAAQNHYKTFGHASPMIFLDKQYWTETKPVYPLISHLAADMDYGKLIEITDARSEALASLVRFANSSEFANQKLM